MSEINKTKEQLGQSKLESLIESAINTGLGFLVAMVTQILIYPLFDIDVTVGDQALLALIFTAVSLVRGYVVRRYFNTYFKHTVIYLSGLLRLLCNKKKG